jgi:P4 family phage/plasmid primase-like protien
VKAEYTDGDMPIPDINVHNTDVFMTPNKKLHEYLIGIGYVTDLDKFKDQIMAVKQEREDNLMNRGKFINEDGMFMYSVFAEWLYKESGHYFVWIRQTKSMYYYKDGIYVPFGETFIKEIVHGEIGWEAIVTKNHIGEIISYIERACTRDIDVMTIHNNTIVCENGVVNLRTKELMPNTPENFAFRRVPYDYVPGAKCPEVDGLISKLIPDSKQASKVYTMVGYTLIDSYIYNKIFFLFGPPGTGKTSITNIITKMLGVNSVSDVRLHDLIKRPFMRVALIDSCVNFCGDASNTPIKDASILKILSGDGRMDVDMKNVAMPLKLQNCSKIVIDTNNMPEFDRRDKALHRRFVKIPFNVVVTEADKSADYMEALSTESEMEGLLSKAIDEAHLILTTENPFKSLSIDDEQSDFESQIWNVVNEFMATHIQIIPEMVDPDVFETQGDIWVQFKAFCEGRNMSVIDIPRVREFNKMFRDKCDIKSTSSVTRNKVNKRGYRTIKLINVNVELSGFTK